MPSIKEFVASLRHKLFDFPRDSPEDITSTAKSLAICTFTKTTLTSHINFIGRCLRGRLVLVGFLVKFHPPSFTGRYERRVKSIFRSCSRQLMHATIGAMTSKRTQASSSIAHHCDALSRLCSADDFHRIRCHIHELNSRYYSRLKSIKDGKLASLTEANRREREHYHPNAGSQPSKLVVTIPTDMPLSDSERSVLSKGLNLVPVKRETDVYQARGDCEHFFRRLRLKAHFRNNEEGDAQPADDSIDPFETFNRKESTWTPPDGQFSALDHYIDRCRRSVNAVDFKARAQYNNLSPAEREVLIRLSKRTSSSKRPIWVVLSWYDHALYTSPKQIVNCPMGGSTNA